MNEHGHNLKVSANPPGSVRPLTLHTMEDMLARRDQVALKNGELFAEKERTEKKEIARYQILTLLNRIDFPRLHILTMSGSDWNFERKLLNMREPGWVRAQAYSQRSTWITSVENSRSVFLAALRQIPGAGFSTIRPCNLKTLAFAEQGMKTAFAQLFFANVDDLMLHAVAHDWKYDVAWLDYLGPLTRERLGLIKQFQDKCVTSILVLTALKARWDATTGAAIENAGGYFPWLRQSIKGEVLFETEYFDTSPMAQFAAQRHEQLWFWA